MFKSTLFVKSMLVVIVLGLTYFFIISFLTLPKISGNIYNLEKKNAISIMDKVSSISNNVYKDIEHFKKAALNLHKENLKHINQIAYSVVQSNYAKYKAGEMSESQAKQLTYEQVSKLKYGEDGYFFILNDNYKMLSHPKPEEVGKDDSQLQDINGKFFAKEIVDNARKNGEAFVIYWLPEHIGKPLEKLSYIKKFEPWNIYLGTGIYIENISKTIQQRERELYNSLHKMISNTTIAQTGYVYVFNSKGIMIHHPEKTLEKSSLKNLKNPNQSTLLYEDLIKAYSNSKELYYLWNKADDKENYIYEKVSWIEYIPELDWYIVSAVYKSELEQSSMELRNSMIQIALFIFVIFIFIASMFFRRIDKDIQDKIDEILTLKERMETALNANRDAVWDVNLQDMTDASVTTRYAEMLGYDKNEIPLNGWDAWKDKAHPEDYDRVMKEAQKNWEGKSDFYESVHRLQHKDGHWIWIHSRGNTIFDEDGKPARFIGTFTDITEKKELEDELRIYKDVVAGTKNHMSYLDTNYIYKIVNPIYLRTHNKSVQEIIGHSVPELFGEDIFINTIKDRLDLSLGGEEVNYSSWFHTAMGDLYMDVSYIPHRDESGKVIGIVVSSNDITKLHNTEEELKNLANTDPLTKLYNRRYLFEISKEILSLAHRDKTQVSLLMIDIDKFKNINDSYGHATGDEVLKHLAFILLRETRESDMVARIGGEEFVILLPSTSKDSAYTFAEKIREIVEKEELIVDNKSLISFTISIGVSEIDLQNDKDMNEALSRADKALYIAKDSGRNRVF